MRHKWADLIIAWAEGADIQDSKNCNDWRCCSYPEWHRADLFFRIKPKTVKKWQWAYKNDYENFWRVTAYLSGYVRGDGVNTKKLEFTEIEVEE